MRIKDWVTGTTATQYRFTGIVGKTKWSDC
jgi:hypothetical protein